MQWLIVHRYLLLVAGATLLLVVGTSIISRDDTPTGASATWSGAGGLVAFGDRRLAYTPESTGLPSQASQTQSAFSFIPLPPAGTADTAEGTDELTKLLAELTQKSVAQSAPQKASSVFDAYSFIPQGLIQLITPKPRSKEQQGLFEYGNAVGALIQSFDALHPLTPQQLRDHAEDRTNTMKAAAIERLGRDFLKLSLDLAALDPIPVDVRALHGAFAAGYKPLGENLMKISKTSRDQEFLDSIAAYNTSADELNKRFLAIATFLSLSEVTFGLNDAGSIFVFAQSAL